MRKTRKKFEKKLKERNLTMYRIAKIIGIDAPVAYYWLWGKSVPNIYNLIRLKEILNVSGDEILEMFAEEATGDGR
jgi:transcriptional regulator with XRE-family HTH domain